LREVRYGEGSSLANGAWLGDDRFKSSIQLVTGETDVTEKRPEKNAIILSYHIDNK
jgi:hypothetical protein